MSNDKPIVLKICGLWNHGPGAYNGPTLNIEDIHQILEFHEQHAPIKFIIRKNQYKSQPKHPDAELLAIPDRRYESQKK